MAPSPIRQLLVWSLPSVAVLLSYLWYKKRRLGARSDTGGSKPIEEEFEAKNTIARRSEAVDIDGSVSEKVRSNSSPLVTPTRKFNRSLSGVETTPIDIVYPRELKGSKSSPVVISDEDLDLEIEKIKSMKNQYNSPSVIASNLSKTPSPAKSDNLKDIDSSVSTESSPERRTNSPICGSTSPIAIKKEPFVHCQVSASKSVKSNNTNPAPKTISKKSKSKNKKQQEKKMAQKDLVAVEEKMSALKVSPIKESPKKESPEADKLKHQKTEEHIHEIHRKNSGRDSANHSPSDVMMASPSLSSMSDHHSEGSSDSGKGGSDVATPPPSRTPQLPINKMVPTCYEFIIPLHLVGKLIGRQGCFVQSIKERCNALVVVRKHPSNNKLKLCSIDGTQSAIDQALAIIRNKFPLKKYPEVTLEKVPESSVVSTVPLIPDYLYLKLIEGINNDTILSCMVAPNHLFMQQPTHPSFPSLSMLMNYMNNVYSDANSPMLPNPIPENTVCAAYSINSWYRAFILSTDEETDTSYVQFLDYGGFAYVENDKLRQIRQDFMLLPFQASECVLANVKSKNEDGSWPDAAYNLVAEITKGSIIYTQVADYTPEGIPLVLCYVIPHHRELIFLNQKLVDADLADWIPNDEEPPVQPQPIMTNESTAVA